MNVLVTGGLGYIGSHTCVQLINAGFNPVIIDNLSNSKVEVLDRIEEITGARPWHYQIDVREEEKLKAILVNHQIDSVIHFASLKSVAESIRVPDRYYESIVGGLTSLLKSMGECKVRKLIFSSTATVYGANSKLPFKEDDCGATLTSPYAKLKFLAEEQLRTYSGVKDWDITILRYFNPIGAHFTGLIGECPLGTPNNLVPIVSQVASWQKDKVVVYGNSYPTKDGTCMRDYIHVMDVADGHLAALNVEGSGEIKTYNLGSGKARSVLDVVWAFRGVSGEAIPISIEEPRPGDIGVMQACIAKARDELNWRPCRSFISAIEDTWNWVSKNPEGY